MLPKTTHLFRSPCCRGYWTASWCVESHYSTLLDCILTCQFRYVGRNVAKAAAAPPSKPRLCWIPIGWLHSTRYYYYSLSLKTLTSRSGSNNCYTDNTWDTSLCPDGVTCAQNCALDGADYRLAVPTASPHPEMSSA
ncbi:gh 7 family exocellobiohydrolase [Moniliophthora roreri MCA 2997]|uniref:cellulose 1,4-beta-cellobiosidase (non-reducing end) n=1 Tax=Moniliophthora roreri (strain MCA 2997) TaxID=1381753 RepID=V2YKL2_MONRO|nr:gh 7 family exocellobiohydrolase [Moniliophthora roreri MCA 2997]